MLAEMGAPVSILWSIALCAVVAGCGGGPRARVVGATDRGDVEGALAAYEELAATEGSDPELLGRVGVTVLLEEIRGDDADRRGAALTQLSLAGTAGEPHLRRLAEAPGTSPARLGALRALARRGDPDAKLWARALADSDDPSVLAVAVLGMDPELDRARLLEHTAAEDPALRAAAVRELAEVASDDAVRERLSELARVDEEARVRASAVRALARGGPAAADILRERLGDPDGSVRLAAVGALAAVDPAAARGALGALLDVPPSPAGIEAARRLATDDDPSTATRARTFLRRALADEDSALRVQAGVAITGLPRDTEAPMDAVREALEREPDAGVRLQLARALARRDEAVGRRALEALLEVDGMPQVQAAAILAADDHAAARRVLARVLAAADRPSLERRTAVRALARDAMRPDAVASALRDDDAFVRIYAAGGILAAAAAS